MVRPGQCGDVGEGRKGTRRHEQVHREAEKLAGLNRESERRREGRTKKMIGHNLKTGVGRLDREQNVEKKEKRRTDTSK